MHLLNNTFLQKGKYKIVRYITSGGFGCTYEAEHIMLKKRVAIKEFFVKDFCCRDVATATVTVATSKVGLVKKLRLKFIEEAQALSQMNHPGIVRVSDVFEENGTAYYVMDYIDGRSLGDMVNRHGPISEREALSYIEEVANALEYVHAHNRLHLDIKPSNIMLKSDDGTAHAILIDFGASKQYDEENGENTSTLLGQTRGYAPLEQMSNSVGHFLPATDIYALGATLYKLLTGITPLDSNLRASGEVLERLPRTISVSTANAVASAMNLKKDLRPQNVKAFLDLLEMKTEDTDFGVQVPGKVRKCSSKGGRRSRFSIWALSLVFVFLVVGGAFFMKRGNKSMIIAQNLVSDLLLEDSIKTFEVKDVRFDMIRVEGGTFQMGNANGGADSEHPVHEVTVSDYFIGKYEVTQKLWRAVMENNPSENKGDDLPVENVSWHDAQAFITKLKELTGQNFSLPSEAQWEFAARGGKKSRGYRYSGSDKVDEVGWFYFNSSRQTHKVGGKLPNELGLYDMTGNVWEWCYDRFGDYPSGRQTNPLGPEKGGYRVMRGCCFGFDSAFCRVSYRVCDEPGSRDHATGFRLALTPDR